jgi:hypothetical protein
VRYVPRSMPKKSRARPSLADRFCEAIKGTDSRKTNAHLRSAMDHGASVVRHLGISDEEAQEAIEAAGHRLKRASLHLTGRRLAVRGTTTMARAGTPSRTSSSFTAVAYRMAPTTRIRPADLSASLAAILMVSPRNTR